MNFDYAIPGITAVALGIVFFIITMRILLREIIARMAKAEFCGALTKYFHHSRVIAKKELIPGTVSSTLYRVFSYQITTMSLIRSNSLDPKTFITLKLDGKATARVERHLVEAKL